MTAAGWDLANMFLRQIIPDIVLVEPKKFADARGWFRETYNARAWRDAGIADAWVQDNESLSLAPGTIRGLHFQIPPMAQAKLISCLSGAIVDVAVDIRGASPTYGQHVAVELSAENGRLLYVPEGFAHGFATLSANTLVQYKVSRPYDPASEKGIAWNDSGLGIDWPRFAGPPVLSPRDASLPLLKDTATYF
jgi:dTDP-4-dehydrorhamnose 3,5-epimerase